MRPSLTFLVAALLVLPLSTMMVGISSEDVEPETSGGDAATSRQSSASSWVLETIASESQFIYEVDAYPGTSSEDAGIIVTGGTGTLNLYDPKDMQKAPETLFVAQKTQIAMATGDVVPYGSGAEIFTSGQDRKAHMVTKEGVIWKERIIWSSDQSVNGIAVGDIEPSRPGNEVAAVGDGAYLALLRPGPTEDADWTLDLVSTQASTVTNMVCTAGDLVPERPGDELLIGTFDGNVLFAVWQGGAWNVTPIWSEGMYAILDIDVADLDDDATGPEIYVASFNGRVMELTRNWTWDGDMAGKDWTAKELFKDEREEAIYGLAVGDADPRHDGNEVVAVGIGTGAHILSWHNDTGLWSNETIKLPGMSLLYGVGVCEADPFHPGPEMLMGGTKENLLELKWEQEGIVVDKTMGPGGPARPGTTTSFAVSVKGLGGYDGDVTVMAEVLAGSAMDVTMVHPSFTVPGLAVVTVRTDMDITKGDHSIEVTAIGGGHEAKAAFVLNVEPLSQPANVNIDVDPVYATAVAGHPVNLVYELDSDDVPDNTSKGLLQVQGRHLHVSLYDGPAGWMAQQGAKDRVPVDTMDVSSAWTNSTEPTGALAWTPSPANIGTRILFVAAYDDFNGNYSRFTVVIEVGTDSIPGLHLVPGVREVQVPKDRPGGSTAIASYEMTAVPIGGYRGGAELAVEGLPQGATAMFTRTTLRPLPATTTLQVTVGGSVAEGPHILKVIATGDDTGFGPRPRSEDRVILVVRGQETILASISRDLPIASVSAVPLDYRFLDGIEPSKEPCAMLDTESPYLLENAWRLPTYKVAAVTPEAIDVDVTTHEWSPISLAEGNASSSTNLTYCARLALAIIRVDPSTAVTEGDLLTISLTISRDGYERTIQYTFVWTSSNVGISSIAAVRGMPARLPLRTGTMKPETFCLEKGDCTINEEIGSNGSFIAVIEPTGDLVDRVEAITIGSDQGPLSLSYASIDVIKRDESGNYVSIEIGQLPKAVDAGAIVRIRAVVENVGNSTLMNVPVYIWVDGDSSKVDTIKEMAPGSSREITVDWQAISGKHNLTVTALMDEPTYDADIRTIEVRSVDERAPLVNQGGLAVASVMLLFMLVASYISKRLGDTPADEEEDRSPGGRPNKGRKRE